jgi:hypothetical protein
VLYDERLSKELSKVTYLIEPRGAVCKLTGESPAPSEAA